MAHLRAIVALCAAATASCVGQAPSPKDHLNRYADALAAGDLERAWKTTSADQQRDEPLDAFRARHADPLRRKALAAALKEKAVRFSVGCAIILEEADSYAVDDRGCVEAAAVEKEELPERVLTRFLDAAEAADFETAYGLLSSDWRRRYTPEAFRDDFSREPLAKDRLARARAASKLPGQPAEEGRIVRFPLSTGRAVTLVREEGRYRVASLE